MNPVILTSMAFLALLLRSNGRCARYLREKKDEWTDPFSENKKGLKHVPKILTAKETIILLNSIFVFPADQARAFLKVGMDSLAKKTSFPLKIFVRAAILGTKITNIKREQCFFEDRLLTTEANAVVNKESG